MIEELGLVLSGLFISTAAMTIGIGGGILWTPLLILAYGLSPQAAVATSLLIQVIGMGSGTFAFLRTNLVDKKLALIFFFSRITRCNHRQLHNRKPASTASSNGIRYYGYDACSAICCQSGSN